METNKFESNLIDPFEEPIELENPKDAYTEIYIKGKYATITTTDNDFLNKIIEVGDKCTEIHCYSSNTTGKTIRYKVLIPAKYVWLIDFEEAK